MAVLCRSASTETDRRMSGPDRGWRSGPGFFAGLVSIRAWHCGRCRTASCMRKLAHRNKADQEPASLGRAPTIFLSRARASPGQGSVRTDGSGDNRVPIRTIRGTQSAVSVTVVDRNAFHCRRSRVSVSLIVAELLRVAGRAEDHVLPVLPGRLGRGELLLRA